MLDTEIVSIGDGDAAPASETITTHRPEFSGRAGEYFGIWFVNLLLSIVTLGIYSAWAKVRTERYFYANTRLAGASFEYLASPISILKGRLIAYAVVIALVISSKFAPFLYLALVFGIAILLPALIVWSLRFRARNSAWRGLSFRFDGGAGAAYGPFMLWGLLVALSLSLVYPVMKKRQHAFVVEGHRYGTRRFSYRGDIGEYYVPYVIAAGLCTALIVAMGVAIIATADAAAAGAPLAQPSLVIFAVMATAYAGFFVVMVLLRICYTNLLWNSAQLDSHRFESNLGVGGMLWLYGSNLVAIVCTLGLAVPWAMVRLARYRAAHFAVHVTGSIDDFVAASENHYGAGSAELIDALDMGVDIGL